MKGILSTLICLLFGFWGKSQESLYGVYKLSITDDNFNQKIFLTLKCNKTFLLENFTFKFSKTGIWFEKNDTLIISFDTDSSKSDRLKWRKGFAYLIKDGKLYSMEKTMSEMRYNQQNKKDIETSKQFGEEQKYEPSSDFIKKAERTFFKKIDSEKCM